MDARLMIKSMWKIASSIIKFLIPGLRRLLLFAVIGWELLFVGYSLLKLALGGHAEVLSWWDHLQIEGGSLERAFEPFSWPQFLEMHTFLLGLAVVLWYFELRYRNRLRALPEVSDVA